MGWFNLKSSIMRKTSTPVPATPKIGRKQLPDLEESDDIYPVSCDPEDGSTETVSLAIHAPTPRLPSASLAALSRTVSPRDYTPEPDSPTVLKRRAAENRSRRPSTSQSHATWASDVEPEPPRLSKKRMPHESRHRRGSSSQPSASPELIKPNRVSSPPPPSAKPRRRTLTPEGLSDSEAIRKPKSILKNISTPSPPPLSPGPHDVALHWQLLPYDPSTSKLKIYFDVAFDASHVRDHTDRPYVKGLDSHWHHKSAGTEPIKHMTIQCNQLPIWDIVIQNPNGITCGDVYEGIHRAFAEPLTPYERNFHITESRRAACEQAFAQRCKDTPGLDSVNRRQGMRRVDLLEGKRIFMGLRRPDHPAKTHWVLEVGLPAD